MTTLSLVSATRDCPGCHGQGWILTTWTGGDLLNRATVPSYAQCRRCEGTGFQPEKVVA